MGWVMGFEPTNTGTTIRGLRPLGDTHHIQFAAQKGMARQKGERCERRRGRSKRAERVAAVDKIEEKRKPEDFIGYRNRTRPQI